LSCDTTTVDQKNPASAGFFIADGGPESIAGRHREKRRDEAIRFGLFDFGLVRPPTRIRDDAACDPSSLDG
jgi:hypothetical protein